MKHDNPQRTVELSEWLLVLYVSSANDCLTLNFTYHLFAPSVGDVFSVDVPVPVCFNIQRAVVRMQS